jgi:hypothetical protein
MSEGDRGPVTISNTRIFQNSFIPEASSFSLPPCSPPTSSRQEQENPLKEGQGIALRNHDSTPFCL